MGIISRKTVGFEFGTIAAVAVAGVVEECVDTLGAPPSLPLVLDEPPMQGVAKMRVRLGW